MCKDEESAHLPERRTDSFILSFFYYLRLQLTIVTEQHAAIAA
jgi:hypothetical protein